MPRRLRGHALYCLKLVARAENWKWSSSPGSRVNRSAGLGFAVAELRIKTAADGKRGPEREKRLSRSMPLSLASSVFACISGTVCRLGVMEFEILGDITDIETIAVEELSVSCMACSDKIGSGALWKAEGSRGHPVFGREDRGEPKTGPAGTRAGWSSANR